MKKFTLTAAICAAFLFIACSAIGQQARDPITNVYKVGGSAEIYMAYNYSISGTHYNKHSILDVPENLNTVLGMDSTDFKYINLRQTASASGDFNGDGADEVVSICNNVSGGIKVTIPLLNEDLTWAGQREYVLEELNDLAYQRVRICSGNFDADFQDEFAISYGLPGEPIRIVLFETDADLNIKLLDNFKEIVYKDYFFDITAGDVDADGIDEIVMVKNEELYTPSTLDGKRTFITNYDLGVYEYDTTGKEIIEKYSANDVKIHNMGCNNEYHGSNRMLEMRIACGDLNADGKDDIVVGWSQYYCYTYTRSWDFWGAHWDYYFYYRDAVYLNTFTVNTTTGDFTNLQNCTPSCANHGQYAGYDGMHIGLSLKCAQLDNVGRDEVLVNSATRLCVMGSSGNGYGLQLWADVAPGYINTRGNEVFMVADLDPDTATLDFNKEVILLLSNQNTVGQLGDYSDIASFEILQTDTIDAAHMAFQPSPPIYPVPFDQINFEVTALLTGDFDLANSDIYTIGTPEVIRVSDLQYPLVILNAPPVHFDVIGGEIHDLCDAFLTDGEPQFSANYYKQMDTLSTTRFDANSSMGFSSDLRAYAMAGGSGFEAAVKTNWEMGKSYYQDKCQSTSIGEGISVFTEDYVLYSSLNYSYYKYPVYESSGKVIGTFAVVNPETEFISNWGSGNSWEHPGYVINHETGNLLSYRPYMNTIDFSTDPAGFSYHRYSDKEVSHTTSGVFDFLFENIVNQGASYSFAGGVGMNLFTKIGAEGSVSAGVKPFGIGVDISTDFRMGVSSELSVNFSQSSLSTRSTELTSSFQIDGKIGRLNENYDDKARYILTPYIYRSQSGALVLDYMISFNATNNNEWWESNYGKQPDLAFILPWKYAEEKGGENIKASKKQKTREIQFYPPFASPGDTVTITTRVHNYSLETFEDWLDLTLYIGDPETGGVELTDIYGNKGISKHATMIYGAEDPNLDFEEYINFFWQVPDTVTCSPRIYAVIDPDNTYAEIHENNNKGWNVLQMLDCNDCGYIEVGMEPQIVESVPMETWPTPTGDHSMVRFYLEQEGAVLLEVFGISGQRVDVVTSGWYPAGDHEISYFAGQLEDGLYFYRLTSGKVTRTAKLVVSK